LIKISRIFREHSQIPAALSPTRSRKRQHELRAPMRFPPWGRLVHKGMSLSSCLSTYGWYNSTPHFFLYLPRLNLSLYSPPSCSFCITSYDIQAVSIFQCIQFLSEIRRRSWTFSFSFFSGDLICLKMPIIFVFVNEMYAHVLPIAGGLTYRQRLPNDVNTRGWDHRACRNI